MAKFLDEKGLQHLWSKISMEDYPNNETLIAVLNAIDQTKLDKSIFEEFIKQTSSTIEPKDIDIPRVYINGVIPTTKDDVLAELTYVSNTETFHSYITIKCQGTSSMSYPKKNFTIKLFEDADRSIKLKKDFRGWGAQNKFCLKANYIDRTHARNIICARLWSAACDTRENLNERLAAAPNNGAIDGFHIKVYANGVYQGLYTWNIPKDGWMFDMDDNGNEAVYCCEVQDARGQFRQEVVVDESDWSLEFPDADEVNGSVKDGFNNLIRVVKDTSDEEFITQISNVLDLEAAIDYYLFCYYFCALDQLGKNMLMVTYDGGATWIPSAYDNDSTWGSYWDGNSMVAYNYACPEQYECSASLLWERIETLFGERLYQRYLELTGTNGPWSLANIITTIERFYDIPRNELYDEDSIVYPGIPQGVSLGSMRTFMANRKNYVDTCLYEIGVQITLESIEFQRDMFTLGSGESIRLRMIYTPNNARNRKITFTSSNPNYITIEPDGDFVILTATKNISLVDNITITAVSEENVDISDTMTITVQPAATWDHSAPVISFDSNDYNNGNWRDNVKNTSMIFSGIPSSTEDGVYFDGSQTCYFSNYSYSNSNLAIEFLGVIDNIAGHNILALSPDTAFSWSNIYGMWTSGYGGAYTESLTLQAIPDSKLLDNKKYVHFLLCCPHNVGGTPILYANIDGTLQTTIGIATDYTPISAAYIGNAEGANHFVGTIRKLNVYNYIPTEQQVRDILYIPDTAAYTSTIITSDMMEIGSLTNYDPYGSPIDWDEEARTVNYINLPSDATEVSINRYYGSDRIYFYDASYKGMIPVVLNKNNQKITIPKDAKYMKFLLMTTSQVDIEITYYR